MLRCLSVLALLGCDSPPTQLVVVVDTDFEVNEELASVAAAVLDAEGQQVSAQELALANDDEAPSATRFAVPLSFGVVPVGGDASRRVTVQIDGRAPDGTLLVQRAAITGFVEGQQLLLPMFLARSCRDVFCEPGQTCQAGACVSAAMPPATLRVIRPGEELSFDASIEPPVDAGSDGSIPPDADAGLVCDEVVMCDGTCSACTTSCCTLECTTSPCSAACATMRTCRVEAPPAGEVDVTCEANSSCEVICDTATRCNVACGPRSQCTVRCPDTGCSLTGCLGELRECAGDVVTCRADCP